MRKFKLSRQERIIEEDLLKGQYVDVNDKELDVIAQAIANRKKDAVLNIRVNSHDLESIKERARKLGIRYQTFISEILHRVARAG